MNEFTTAEHRGQTATELAAQFRKKIESPVDVTRQLLDRIAKHDPYLNCYVTVDNDAALQQAEYSQKRCASDAALSNYDGVPICIKDLTPTKDLRTTFSSRTFRDYVPSFDAPVVARLKSAGLIILGKTNTPEFGALPITTSVLNGTCVNPLNIGRTPGGSSGGSAAALAADLCFAAHGSDGAGSIRLPANWCGLVGYKPSAGRIPGWRKSKLISSATSDGLLTKCVSDMQGLAVIIGAISDEAYVVGDRPRVAAILQPPILTDLTDECSEAVMHVARTAQQAGCEVREVDPKWYNDSIVDHMLTSRSSIARSYGVFNPELLDPFLANMALLYDSLSPTRRQTAADEIETYGRQLTASFNEWDFVITPVATHTAPLNDALQEVGDSVAQFRWAARLNPFAPLCNLSGNPAIALPCGTANDGLPLGVQIVGHSGEDGRLLQFARQLEKRLVRMDGGRNER